MEWIRKYCKTFDREGQVLPWPDWEFFDELIGDLEAPGVSLWIKSRQMMCSWLASAYALHMVVFNPLIAVIAISRNLEQVLDIHDRVCFMYRNLPGAFRLPRDTDNMKVFDLKHSDGVSSIKFSPAGRNAGRGTQTKFFIADEFAFMGFASDIFTGLKPSIDGGGRGLILSTGNGNHRKNKFAQLIQDRAELGFKFREVHYSLCPEKDDAWKARARLGLSQAEWDQEHECKLITMAGLVYQEFSTISHLVDMPELHDNGKFYLSVDFGFNNPFVAILYYCPAPDYDTFYVVREHYKSETLIKDHAAQIIQMLCIPRFIGGEFIQDPPPLRLEFGDSLVVDPSAKQERMELVAALETSVKDHWQGKPEEWRRKYPSKPRYRTISGETSIRAGINAVKEKLEVDPRLGRPKFLIAKGPDNKPVAPNMVFEFENYSEAQSNENRAVPKNDDENPIKLNDHAMDCNKNLILKLRQPVSKGHKRKPRGL